jgi:nucleotide-binding universal stress UspA family protein
MYTKVLLAYDGSEAGQKALLDCREIVQWSHAELQLIAVMPRPVTSVAAEGWVYTQEADVAQRDRHQAVLDQGLQRLRDAGLNAEGELVQGDSVEEIANCARRIGVGRTVAVNTAVTDDGPNAGKTTAKGRRSPASSSTVGGA